VSPERIFDPEASGGPACVQRTDKCCRTADSVVDDDACRQCVCDASGTQCDTAEATRGRSEPLASLLCGDGHEHELCRQIQRKHGSLRAQGGRQEQRRSMLIFRADSGMWHLGFCQSWHHHLGSRVLRTCSVMAATPPSPLCVLGNDATACTVCLRSLAWPGVLSSAPKCIVRALKSSLPTPWIVLSVRTLSLMHIVWFLGRPAFSLGVLRSWHEFVL
jgi:hypothetical protein